MLALHFAPVRSEVAGPEPTNTLFLFAAIWLIASATPEFGTSTIRSTLSTSNHWLAMLRADVGLVLMVAADHLDLHIRVILACNRPTAILAATSEPGPVTSA